MNTFIIITVIIVAVFFIVKIHRSAAKFDKILHGETKLRDYENEHFIESEVNRVLLLIPYIDENGCLPENVKRVSISDRAKEIIDDKVTKTLYSVLNQRAEEDGITDTTIIVHAYADIGRAISKALRLIYL